ncbi:hypothetical protein D9Q98_009653 [Chlorella vulgaris]|uniref:FAS1 domain-containing protein n=1 Tax=Chlorella vulgaris TaxID=3077 RepID=A0A9D4YSF9_CHLVU|nr:hypothetical protein D9Q98_009653 [Chlorella vulgaris]
MRKAPRAIALVLGLVLLLQPAAGQWPGAPAWRFGGLATAQPAQAAQSVPMLPTPGQPQGQPVPAMEQPGSALPASAPVVELLPPAELMPRPSDCSLWDVLQTTPNVTFFLQAVQAVGLTGLLADPAFVATVFLPSDRAWDNLLRELGWSTQQLLTQQPLDSLRDVIEYHFVEDAPLPVGALAALPYLDRLTTMFEGQPVLVFYQRGLSGVSGVKLASTGRQTANLVQQINTGACSGLPAVAHLVDAVLTPDPEWSPEDFASVSAMQPATEATAVINPTADVTLSSFSVAG